MLKKLWKDSVWSKVIAWGIISAVTFGGIWLFNAWPIILNFLKIVFNWLCSCSLLPNWLIILLAANAVFTIIVIILVWRKEKHKKIYKNQPTDVDYTTDIFFNMRWVWQFGGNYGVFKLHALCLQCSYELEIEENGFGLLNKTIKCEHCQNKIALAPPLSTNLKARVEKEIHRKIRTGEWSNQFSKT